MSYSGRKINYTLRPAKNVERKMICEYLRNAGKAFDISEYRYLGFGASYFSDFILFHNEFNIRNMISMEKCTDIRDRFEFNKPYGNIEIIYGEAEELLKTQISWNNKTKDIIWLDYDDIFEKGKINQIEYCVNKIVSGSFLLVSFNSSIKPDENGDRMPQVKELFDEDKLPVNLKEKDLDGSEIHKFYHKIMRICMEKAMLEKNSRYIEECDKYSYKQIMFYKYKDAAPMLTLGYVFYKNSDIDKINQCKFDKLAFFAEDDEPYSIDVPNFTQKEIQSINKMLPNKEEIKASMKFISSADIEKYARIYRYYPHFLETNFTN